MQHLNNLVKAVLYKMGLSDIKVLEASISTQTLNRFHIIIDVPVSQLIPFYKRYIERHSISDHAGMEKSPLGRYLLNADSLHAGPVSLRSFRFAVSVNPGNVRIVHPRPELLHAGYNREILEYVFYRSSNVHQDIILGLVEHGSEFISFIHDQIQSKLASYYPLVVSLVNKSEASSKPEMIHSIRDENYGFDVSIMADAIPLAVAEKLLCDEWCIESVSCADQYLNYLHRYLSGRVMKRCLYAVYKSNSGGSTSFRSMLGRLSTSPLVMTEYKINHEKSIARYEKTVLSQLEKMSHSVVDNELVLLTN
ncbi:hypothetical protein [Yersinia enterocolitica]|uniref:hypothetical protein n=1 Tax=Yersinia enterocolitica TaxID=630 RepID=UPI003D03227F